MAAAPLNVKNKFCSEEETPDDETNQHTWRQKLAEAAGVHQHVGLKGGIKLIVSAEGRAERSRVRTWRSAARGLNICVSHTHTHTCCTAKCQGSKPGQG